MLTLLIDDVVDCKNSNKYCHKSIDIGIGNTFQKQYWYGQYFLPKYCIVSILTVVFTSIVNIPGGSSMYIFLSHCKTVSSEIAIVIDYGRHC